MMNNSDKQTNNLDENQQKPTTNDFFNDKNNQLTKVLNIPSVVKYTESKIKKSGKNFSINLIITTTTMFIVIGIIITIAIAIGIKLG
ncbi:conserved hypothetical protein [Ureaplasma urealyticum serovar 7 str. ATCC 27819]|uniref:Uncharacterized protein n=4 Tax=Ureaplasma urealyticum TaxID=2130 RepID=A0ABD4SLZ7_UREUR|nr:hypothetical protein [Ureaplasma urealyticum]EDU56855.1 conserved hypothetical protein [Ureaplasma urealyticum serovar 7 str. ATCC 27819]MCF1349003.1 hypothetical protein [Ureaplasma urealyticum]UIU15377.1 hypothetical protein LLZ88_01680 [Ureaplasma urealyticum]